MTDSNARVALVGAGFIAEYHLEILRRTAGVEVVAVVDVSESRARSLAERFGIKRWFTQIDTLVKEAQPQIAHVVVPPAVHATVVEELLRHKVGVFVEKPMATTAADCDRLVALAEDQGVALGVNHNHVFHPSFQQLKRWVESGKLGHLQHVFACLHVPLRQLDAGDFSHWMFREPGNIVLEQAPHPFSQLRELLGEVRSVTTRISGDRDLLPGMVFHDTWQIAAEFERGPATILLSFGKDMPESWLHVMGQDGAVRIDLLRQHELAWNKTPWMDFLDQLLQGERNARRSLGNGLRGAAQYVTSLLKLRDRSDVFYVGMKSSIQAFHRAWQAAEALPCSGRDGAAVVRLCEQVTASLEPAAVPVQPAAAPVHAAVQEPSGSAQVLVTGATGFLGRHLIPRLRCAGYSLRVLVRRPGLLPEYLREPDIEVVTGSLEDRVSLQKAVQGVETVLHLATGGGTTWQQIETSMVGGCREIAEACLTHDVQRLLFTSSIAACFLGESGALASGTAEHADDVPPDSRPQQRALYARGKIACEQLLLDLHRQRGLPVTLFRPGVVVGEGGPVQHSGAGLWTRDTQCFGWGMGNHGLPWILVGDVADALVAACRANHLAGRSLDLVGDVRLTAREYVTELGRLSGRPFQFHPQPLWWMQAIELFKWGVKIAIRRPHVEFPSYRDLSSRSLAGELSNAPAKSLLNWQPVADRTEFLQQSIAWYALRQRFHPGRPKTAYPLSGGGEVSELKATTRSDAVT
jgi:predicted dehydrogenase/nucleoside-diphosphate-sugar epimerase